MRNSLSCLLLVYCLHGCYLHTRIWAQERSGCSVVGMVFDIDLRRRSLMLKDKTGFIATIDLPAKVEIAKLGVGDAASQTRTNRADGYSQG